MTKLEYEKIGELLYLRKQLEYNIETFQYCITEAYIKTRYSGEDVFDTTYLNEKEIQCLKECFIKELEEVNKELKELGYDD